MIVILALLFLIFAGGAAVRGAARLAGGILFCLCGLLLLICAFSAILLKIAIITTLIMALGILLVVLLIILARTPRAPMLAFVAAVPVLGATLILAGCSPSPSATANPNTANPASLQADIGLINAIEGTTCVPHKLLVAVDQTGSREWNGVVSLTPTQLGVILDGISTACGGEVALAAIRDESNVPFQRCSFDAPPAVGALPEKPSTTGNIFEVKRQSLAYEKRVAEMAARLGAWQARAVTARSECVQKLSQALGPVPLARKTDIGGILNRARLYFSEEDDGGALSRKTFLVLSDAIDNVHRVPPPNLGASVDLVLVNSAGSIGELASYDPKRFESTDAALKYVFRQRGREQ